MRKLMLSLCVPGIVIGSLLSQFIGPLLGITLTFLAIFIILMIYVRFTGQL